ncbi:MAG TPA: TIM barrel protein [Solirubrobacteraceae bacterium]
MPAYSGIAVGNAPVSYGAFEITVGVDPNVPDPVTLLDSVAQAGYVGIDLGPIGYLGTGDELAARLSDRGLALTGGYIELPLADRQQLDPALAELDVLLGVLAVASLSGPAAKPTLAAAASDAGWRAFADGLARAVERCRERGLEPTFHHHAGTYVQTPQEIERLLECSDVGLCLDTGHLLVGGGEPLAAVRAWAERINHVHLKDARRATIEQIAAEAAPVQEIWRRGAFCALGEGDIEIPAVLDALGQIGYAGWLVVEQDILPDSAEPGRPAIDQRRNREYLRTLGL